MGKRGPKPKDRHETKSAVFSTRITPATRIRLEEAARESGRPLSREIETRLSGSFEMDRDIEKRFGDERTYALMLTIADVIRRSARGRDWLNERDAFDHVARTVARVLREFRPPKSDALQTGEIMRNDDFGKQSTDFVVGHVLANIREVKGESPKITDSREQCRARHIKARLGALAERPPLSRGMLVIGGTRPAAMRDNLKKGKPK